MSPRISVSTSNRRNAIMTHVYRLNPKIAIASPLPPPIAGDRLDFLRRELHRLRRRGHALAAVPTERVRALQLRTARRALGALPRRRDARRSCRAPGLGRSRRGFGGRGRRSSAPVENGAALVALLRVLRHEGAADRADEPAEHDAPAAEPEVPTLVEVQLSSRIELEAPAGIELQGASRAELKLAVRIEIQEARHAPPLSPGTYPGVRP